MNSFSPAMVDQQRRHISELQFDEFPTPSSMFLFRFPSKVMLWIKEVEMVDSEDVFKSSRSIKGTEFQNIEMLDAKIASALN